MPSSNSYTISVCGTFYLNNALKILLCCFETANALKAWLVRNSDALLMILRERNVFFLKYGTLFYFKENYLRRTLLNSFI